MASSPDQKTILITGGAGFIGGHLAQRLLRKSDTKKVIAVDILNEYYDPSLKMECLQILEKVNSEVSTSPSEKKFHFHQADITDMNAMRNVFGLYERIDVVVHLAAQPGVRFSVENPVSVINTNVIGTQVVFDVAREFRVPYICASSSSSVYGGGSTPPYSESEYCHTPLSPYAASKMSNELFAHTFNHLYNIPITMLRFFTVYGPRGRPDMAAFKFIDKIHNDIPIDRFGDGSMIREFTYIDDIINGVIRSIERQPEDKKVRVVNLGGGATHSLSDFITIIEKHMGKKAVINVLPMQPGDVMLTSACQKKALKELGFQPEIGLDEGIKRTVDWYRGWKDGKSPVIRN